MLQVFLIDFMAPLRFLFARHETRSKELFDEFIALETRLYREARATFEQGQVSVCVALCCVDGCKSRFWHFSQIIVVAFLVVVEFTFKVTYFSSVVLH